MMKPEYKRNRHINPKRLMLLILIPVLLIAGGFGVYKIMAEDTYAAYNTYDESNKKEGTMEHFTEEKEDTPLPPALAVPVQWRLWRSRGYHAKGLRSRHVHCS